MLDWKQKVDFFFFLRHFSYSVIILILFIPSFILYYGESVESPRSFPSPFNLEGLEQALL